MSWDTPGPMDEVLITVEGRRAADGVVFANAQVNLMRVNLITEST